MRSNGRAIGCTSTREPTNLNRRKTRLRRGYRDSALAVNATPGILGVACVRGGSICVALLVCLLASRAHSLTLSEVSPLAGAARAFHPYSLASIDNALAIVANPAGIAVRPSAEFFMLVTDSDRLRDGDNAFIAKMQQLGLAYERYRPVEGGARVSRLTLATGRSVTRAVTVGVSYGWFFSDNDDLASLSSLDFGVHARPLSRIAFAGAAYGYNRPSLGETRISRHYEAGVELSPITQWLALFFEGSMTSEDNLAGATAAYGAEIEPIGGIVLRGRADTDGDYRVGFEYNFNQSGYGVVGLYRHSGGSDGRAGYIRLTESIYRRGRGQ